MAGLGVLEVTDATFEQEVLQSEQPMPGDRADRGWSCTGIRRQAESGKSGRGSQCSDAVALWNQGNSGTFVLQGRQGGRPGCGIRSPKRD
jgi:hypothetical protein